MQHLAQASDDAHRVGLVEDRELRAAEAERLRLGAEHEEAEAVERRDVQVLRDRLADEIDDALAHLGGGLVSERHREDRPRRDAALEQARHALRDDARLARARAGEDEHRPHVVLDGSLLRRVQRNHAPGYRVCGLSCSL